MRGRGGTLLRRIHLPDARFLAIHRADLHTALRTAVNPDRIRLGCGVINVAAPADPATPLPALEHLSATAQLGWHLPGPVSAADVDTVFATATRTVHSPVWATGRVVLIGDAAHAMHPISGMGASAASAALADARSLADALQHHSGDATRRCSSGSSVPSRRREYQRLGARGCHGGLP